MAKDDLVLSNEQIAAELASDADGADTDTATEEQASPLDSDAEIPSWEDQQSDEEEADLDADTPQAKRKQPQAVRQYKANGKTHDVDHSDTKRVDELITLGLGARQVFSERDKLRKEQAAKDAELAEVRKYKGLWDKLEASKGDHDALYEKIFGKKFDEATAERRKWSDDYDAASPAERRVMDMQKQMEAQQRAWSDKQKQVEEAEKTVAQRAEEAQRREVKASLLPDFHKHEFSQKIKDPETAAEMNAALWRLTVGNLRKQFGTMDELDPEAVRREFAKVAKMLGGNATEQAKAEVAKVTEEKKQVSKQKAQVASTRNYAGSGETAKLAKEKDPVKLFRKMFG